MPSPPRIDATSSPMARRPQITRSRVLAWLALAFLVVAIIAVSLVIAQRRTIAQNQFIEFLERQGIAARLTVDTVSQNELILEDVELRDADGVFLTVDRVRAEYVLRDALAGRIESLAFTGIDAVIVLDEDFKLISGWAPPGSGGPPSLPAGRVTVTEGGLVVRTPYGALSLIGEADATSLGDWTAELILSDSDIDHPSFSGRVNGRFEGVAEAGLVTGELTSAALRTTYPVTSSDSYLEWSGQADLNTRSAKGDYVLTVDSIDSPARLSGLRASGRVDVGLSTKSGLTKSTLTASEMEWADISTSEAKLDVDAALSWSEGLRLVGSLAATAMAVESGIATVENSALSWTGILARNDDATGLSSANGTLTTDLGGVTLSDRRGLADTLSLNRILRAAPVTRDFADLLRNDVAVLLRDAELKVTTRLLADGNTVSAALTDPLQIVSGQRRFSVAPVDTPFYRYDLTAQDLILSGDVFLSGERPLRLDAFQLTANSPNGFTLNGVGEVSASLTLPRAWTARTPTGQTTRIDPFSAQLAYDGGAGSTRLNGALAFTGDLPGGYVEGLRTRGDLRVDSVPTLSTRFQPARNAPLTIDRVTTTAGLVVTDFSAELVSNDPIYRRDGGSGRVVAKLKNTVFTLAYPANGQILDIEAGHLLVAGQITDDEQNWGVQFTDASLTSDTFISTGTVVRAAEGTASAILPVDAPLTFTFQTPSAIGQTALATFEALPIRASGELTDIAISYGSDSLISRVTPTNPLIPEAPLLGQATFRDGRLQGMATAYLDEAPSVPIEITYDVLNGAGSAQIRLDDLTFQPRGLQPQTLFPAFSGLVNRVEGQVDASLDIAFADGVLTQSAAAITLDGIGGGTAPGVFSGVNGRLTFDSLLPLRTSDVQSLRVASFDPGFLLEDGVVEFRVLPGQLDLVDARWPLGDGFIALEPTLWTYGAEINRAALIFEDVSVQGLLDTVSDNEKLSATGLVSGRLPVKVQGVVVTVEGGRLSVPGGGVIAYNASQIDTAAAQNPTTNMVFEALRNFRYDELVLEMDGVLGENIVIQLDFLGGGDPRVLYGSTFDFSVRVEGELLNILRSLNTNETIKAVAQGDLDSRILDEIENSDLFN